MAYGLVGVTLSSCSQDLRVSRKSFLPLKMFVSGCSKFFMELASFVVYKNFLNMSISFIIV